MADRFDQILWFLERHRRPVLIGVAVVVLASVVGLIVRGGGSSKAHVPKGAVAIVGDQPITQATFDHWAGVYRRSGVGGASPTTAQVDRAVIQILVAASWTRQEAARQHVAISQARIDQATKATFSTAKAQGVNRATVLRQVGGSVADLVWEEQASLLGQALELKAARSAPAPSTADIAARYTAEPQRWAHATQRDAQVILSSDQATSAKALAALRAGGSWSAVAKQYATSSRAGTRLRTLRPGTHDPAFERVVFAAPVNRLEGPVHVGSGWIVFQILKSTPIAPVSLASATRTLRTELTGERQSSAVSAYLRRFRAEWKARTRCIPAVRDPMVCAS